MPDTIRLTVPVAYNLPGSRAGGLDLDHEPIGFNGQFSPYMKNMIVESTRVRKRQGYTRLGTGPAMSGIGMALINYTDALGSTHLIALTSTKAYHYNASTDAWDNITEQVQEEGETQGDDIDWTGDADDRFGYAVVTDATAFANNGGSALCVVNGVDDVKFFEGDGSDIFATLVHAFPSFSSCIDIAEFWNHLMFIGYTDTAKHSRSLAFAGIGNIDDWTSATSGATTLTDTIGSIVGVAKLGLDLIIYSERSISKCQYIGGALIFIIPTIYYDIGLFSFGSLCPFGKSHLFLATDQRIYALVQGTNLADIGDRVCRSIFGDISFDDKNKIASGYDQSRQKAMFAIVTASETYAKKVYAVSTGLEGQPWEMYEFAHDIRSIAPLRRTKDSVYCDDTEWTNIYCDETTAYCDDKYGQEGSDQTCFLTSAGYVYKIDEALGTDAGSDINCEYQTEDIILNEEDDNFRALWLTFDEMSSVACSFNAYYSKDSGATWTELADSPVTPENTDWNTYKLPLDVTSRKLRIKFAQSGFGDLQLRGSIKLDVVPCGPRS